MRKLGWYALRATVAAFVLGSLLLLAANLYVQSHGVQQRIREALEASLKMPVSLQKTTVTPWDGLRLDGVVLRTEEADDTGSAPQGRARQISFMPTSFRVQFAWWPLVTQRRVVIERVLLDKPRLVWQQDDDGRWSFPPGQDRVRLAEANELARENAAAPGTPPPAPDVPPPPPDVVGTPIPGSLPSVEESAAEASEAERPFKGFPLLIDKLHVRHGEMDRPRPRTPPSCPRRGDQLGRGDHRRAPFARRGLVRQSGGPVLRRGADRLLDGRRFR